MTSTAPPDDRRARDTLGIASLAFAVLPIVFTVVIDRIARASYSGDADSAVRWGALQLMVVVASIVAGGACGIGSLVNNRPRSTVALVGTTANATVAGYGVLSMLTSFLPF